jgi:hypothetical protein
LNFCPSLLLVSRDDRSHPRIEMATEHTSRDVVEM